MKFNQIFITLFLAMLAANGHAMQQVTQQPATQKFEVLTFDKDRDTADITEIFRSDWNRLEANRPFNHELISALLDPRPGNNDFTKWIKVLRHNQKTIGFIAYYFWPSNKCGSFEVGAVAPEYRKKGLAKHYFPMV